MNDRVLVPISFFLFVALFSKETIPLPEVVAWPLRVLCLAFCCWRCFVVYRGAQTV